METVKLSKAQIESLHKAMTTSLTTLVMFNDHASKIIDAAFKAFLRKYGITGKSSIVHDNVAQIRTITIGDLVYQVRHTGHSVGGYIDFKCVRISGATNGKHALNPAMLSFRAGTLEDFFCSSIGNVTYARPETLEHMADVCMNPARHWINSAEYEVVAVANKFFAPDAVAKALRRIEKLEHVKRMAEVERQIAARAKSLETATKSLKHTSK